MCKVFHWTVLIRVHDMAISNFPSAVQSSPAFVKIQILGPISVILIDTEHHVTYTQS